MGPGRHNSYRVSFVCFNYIPFFTFLYYIVIVLVLCVLKYIPFFFKFLYYIVIVLVLYVLKYILIFTFLYYIIVIVFFFIFSLAFFFNFCSRVKYLFFKYTLKNLLEIIFIIGE